MVESFFSTVGDPLLAQVNSDQEDGDQPQQASAMAAFASGPTFVKSTETTLFSEESDIRNSRQKKAKVTFAKPRPKAAVAEKMANDESNNFTRKGGREDRETREKVQRLEEQVTQVYGSKAYQMLQKMSKQKNRRDVAAEAQQELLAKAFNTNQELEQSKTEDLESENVAKTAFELGQGIGKQNQGILNPVQPELRPAQGGIGFNQTEKPKRQGKRGKSIFEDDAPSGSLADVIDMDIHDKEGDKKKDEEIEQKKQKLDAEDKAFLDLFQKNKREKRVNFREQFDQMQSKLKVENGVEEVAAEQTAASLGDTMKRLNIIDMTGGALQVQTSASVQKKAGRKLNDSLLKKILKVKDEAKFNVKALVQREEYQMNLKIQLEQEKSVLEQTTGGATLVLQELKDFDGELQAIVKTLDDKSVFKVVHAKCSDLAERFPTLYQSHTVSHKIAARLLKDHLAPFDFQKQSLLNFDTYLAVRNLLTIGCDQQSLDHSETAERNTTFMQLAFDTYWLPSFRSFAMGHLDMRTPAGVLLKESLSQWSALMPDQVTRKVVSQILMPKLLQSIGQPSSATSLKLDDWLVPWTDLIGKRNMRQLFDEYKVQITPIFADKKLFKKRGLEVLKPWISVLEAQEIQSFANRYIIPKLTSLAKRLEVDPTDQKLTSLTLIFAWTKTLPLTYSLKHCHAIIKEHLLPKLLQTLQSWLDIVEVGEGDAQEIDEILVWYEGWKSFLLEEHGSYAEVNRVQECFYLMMLLIEKKLDGLS